MWKVRLLRRSCECRVRFAVVDPNDELLFCEANVERFELVTGPPLAKVSLKP